MHAWVCVRRKKERPCVFEANPKNDHLHKQHISHSSASQMGAGYCALGFLFVQPSVFLFLGAGLCGVSHLSSLILKTPTFQWLSATLGRHLMKTDALSGAWPSHSTLPPQITAR